MILNKVSIIIPCFNSGRFLLEALESCQNSIYEGAEVIIIDDGSYCPETLEILHGIRLKKSLQVLYKLNGGPASARNFGAKHSKGDFLLFLDSDNLIRPDYLSKALALMSLDQDLGVVYSKPAFFGATKQDGFRFEVKGFNFDALLAGNFIDMCSLVRKEAFLEVGGFDEHSDLVGWEDAELWIRLAQTKWKFKFLDEILFDYRIREDSLMGLANNETKERMLRYLGAKHGFVIHQRYRQYFRVMDQIQKNPLSYFLRILYYKYIKRQPFIK